MRTQFRAHPENIISKASLISAPERPKSFQKSLQNQKHDDIITVYILDQTAEPSWENGIQLNNYDDIPHLLKAFTPQHILFKSQKPPPIDNHSLWPKNWILHYITKNTYYKYNTKTHILWSQKLTTQSKHTKTYAPKFFQKPKAQQIRTLTTQKDIQEAIKGNTTKPSNIQILSLLQHNHQSCAFSTDDVFDLLQTYGKKHKKSYEINQKLFNCFPKNNKPSLLSLFENLFLYCHEGHLQDYRKHFSKEKYTRHDLEKILIHCLKRFNFEQYSLKEALLYKKNSIEKFCRLPQNEKQNILNETRLKTQRHQKTWARRLRFFGNKDCKFTEHNFIALITKT